MAVGRANRHTGDISIPAAGNLSALQFTFVTMSAEWVVDTCGAGGKPVGVQQNKPDAAGKLVAIVTHGPTQLVVDGNAGAISRLSWLKSDSAGKGVATTTDKDVVGAMALQASSAAGDVIPAIINIFTLDVS